MDASPPDPLSQPTYCTACGRPLGVFAEDQPDWATGPICGECYQEVNFEDEANQALLFDDDEAAW